MLPLTAKRGWRAGFGRCGRVEDRVTDTKGEAKPAKRRDDDEFVPPGVLRSFFRAPGVFYRECVAELRKVVWPTRQQVFTYTSVVLVFVLIMIGIVTGLDFVFGKGVLQIFQ
ncbi:MAG: preprotein translocase subunit SecE [Streptosporangiales bacterium]|nr:preprotein translocase subunit SecE [Streptosporangiales bacterium]